MFIERSLPVIQKMAQSMGVGVHVVDATRGAPMSVTLTPLLVYQNYRGRSIYQGRTTTPGRIRNFIRTSRYVPQGEAPHRRANIPVWSRDRSRLWAPLKVSSVTGSQPQNYRRDKFTAEALDNIKKGFRKFQLQETAGPAHGISQGGHRDRWRSRYAFPLDFDQRKSCRASRVLR